LREKGLTKERDPFRRAIPTFRKNPAEGKQKAAPEKARGRHRKKTYPIIVNGSREVFELLLVAIRILAGLAGDVSSRIRKRETNKQIPRPRRLPVQKEKVAFSIRGMLGQ
jgi:hypothetical protein